MSFMLGVYSKKGDINRAVFEEVIKDFSLGGERNLRIQLEKKALLISATCEAENRNIAENEDKSLLTVFAGRIYDFRSKLEDLIKKGHIFQDRRSGVEFIAHSYEEYGPSFLRDAEGTFTFAVYDRSRDKLTVCNDNFGLYPLFYYDCGDHIIFSTEYEPITEYRGFDGRLDYDAIAEYFCFRFTLGEKTFFKDIRGLPPGSMLDIENGKVDIGLYGDFDIRIDSGKNISFFAREISEAVKRAVRMRVEENKDMVFTLSGGADTRLILSNLTEKERSSIVFMTSHRPYLNDDEDQDLVIARLLAERLKLNHRIKEQHPKTIDAELFRKVRTPAKPVSGLLTGQYGGELLGGYVFKMAPAEAVRMGKREVGDLLRCIFTASFLEKISDPFLSLKKEYEKVTPQNKELFFFFQSASRAFFSCFYGGSRAGWLYPHRFTTRIDSIFWSNDFLKLLLTVPKNFLLDYRLYNEMYKVHFRELTDIPSNSFLAKRKDSCIPLMDIGRDGKSFTPPQYSEILKDYMTSAAVWDKGFYNKEYVMARSGSVHDPIIVQLMDFETWYKVFVSKAGKQMTIS